MTPHPLTDPAIRQQIIADPAHIIEDADLMRAIVSAADGARGANVIDMRAIAMTRLEARLDKLEDTHRSVVAAAYGNLSGMTMVHRAALELLEADGLAGFLGALRGPVTDILRIEGAGLLLEAEEDRPVGHGGAITLAEPGCADLLTGIGPDGAPNRVTLRKVPRGDPDLYGERAAAIRSEACLALDLGPRRLPGVLILGAVDPQQFAPGQGTDLLAFLGGVVERSLRRLLE